jgi:hypothetical protein
MADLNAASMGGVVARGYRRGGTATDPWDQYVIPVDDKVISYKGRVATFRSKGRAAVQQNIFSIHNATASTVLVDVTKITCDFSATVVKAVTVMAPIFRVWRVTVLPTNGTALTKVAEDTALGSNASVTIRGDSSADDTLSATTLTATIPAGNIITQELSSRIITAAGVELMDRAEFIFDDPITLRALEGLVVTVDAIVTTGFPATDHCVASCRWVEYTRP